MSRASASCDDDALEVIQAAAAACVSQARYRNIHDVIEARTVDARRYVCKQTDCLHFIAAVDSKPSASIVNCSDVVVGSLELTDSDVTAIRTYACDYFNETPAPTVDPLPDGFTSTAVLLAALGGMLLVVFTIGGMRLYRRWRRGDGEDEVRSTKVTDLLHVELETPRPDLGPEGLWRHPRITAVRIPLEKIQLGLAISQGGFGEVFKGCFNGQDVAVKRLLPVRRKDMANITSFLEEVKLTAELDHACIVRFIGVAWESPADLCMVTEFLAGGDLRSLVNEFARTSQPLGFDTEKLRIGIQIAHALTYLHSLQPVVVHRDLKSRNILLTEELDAKLIDFGVSCERQDFTMTAGVGSSLWMSPEVMMGERYDEKADVFSFGVVLSEMDTHELPYAHAKETDSDRKIPEMAVLQLVAQGKLTARFSELADPQVVALARQCLERQPAARPTSSEVLYRLHVIWQGRSFVL